MNDIQDRATAGPYLRRQGGFAYFDIGAMLRDRGRSLDEFPFVIRIFLENLCRTRWAGEIWQATEEDIDAVIDWRSGKDRGVPLQVGRVILPDSSGLPVLQDLAALRDAVERAGGDTAAAEPVVPVDLIVDHSLQVDYAGVPDAIARNLKREFERNGERYTFLKWAQNSFKTLRVFPPGTGIIHQVNLEHLAKVADSRETVWGKLAFPDFVIGGDSHTPMVNSLGVLGWGVGGLDAEAALLGQPYIFPVPDVVGVRLTGRLPPGSMTTDLALVVTERLRKAGVTGKMVEFGGSGVAGMSVPERATLANMAPEYGATCGFFPVDARTLAYLRQTGRSEEQVALVEAYCRTVGLFADNGETLARCSRIVQIDLSEIRTSVAGPKRPQDRLPLPAVSTDFKRRLAEPPASGGFGMMGEGTDLPHGSIVIAALTSCTNTSNPTVMLAAGLVAKKAVAAGLRPPSWVKTSLAPGSQAVTEYLRAAGLLPSLEALGFQVIGYGCTSCSGKSGPLDPGVAAVIEKDNLVAAAVLSGNRNFEGRIHRLVRANYIMSPPLVVAYALAGRIDIDLETEPLGIGANGQAVYLKDIWPETQEIEAVLPFAEDKALFSSIYRNAERGPELWRELPAPSASHFPWSPQSTYLVEPPFLTAPNVPLPDRLLGARALAVFGDSLTTDHISPSGEIPLDTPAARYLLDRGVAQKDFSVLVARRCNHEIMARATFANLRIRNALVPDIEGGMTRHFPDGEVMTIFNAATRYRRDGTPVLVLGGKEYGTGSSRDWAAKGPALLGVRVVIAESFERIHRANLVAMGILPLRFQEGEGWRQLGLNGDEAFDLKGLEAGIAGGFVEVVAQAADRAVSFKAKADLLTEAERRLIRDGGMLPAMLKNLLAA